MEVKESVPSPGNAAFTRAASPTAMRANPEKRLVEPPNVLLVAAAQFSLPYRVLRCLTEAGTKVFVLGGAAARGLRTSRYCRRFIDCESRIDGRLSIELILELNRVIESHSIDLVVAGDPLATRSLIESSKMLAAPCFPMPDLGAFDLLNDKWRFTKLCNEMGILCPQSRLFADSKQLIDEVHRGGLSLPLIAKPLSEDANRGCITITRKKDIKAIGKIAYSPIIVQQYISGIDIGASIFCRDGEIEAYLVHCYRRGIYTAYDDPRICISLAKIARHFRLNGIFNFDMRLAPGGEVFFLECNPRVFFKCVMSMLAGINFLEFGIPSRCAAEMPRLTCPVAIQIPMNILPTAKNILRMLLTPWKFDGSTWKVVKFLSADPVPLLRKDFGFERGR